MTSRIHAALATMIAACLIAIMSGTAAARQDLVQGAAVAIAPSVFVTNHDLVADCNAISIAKGDRRAGAKVITSDEIDNLALVSADIATGGLAALRRDPEIGEPVVIASVPLLPASSVDAAVHLVQGTVAAVTGPGDDSRFLQISARLQAKDSGGPVLDARGNVVGVIDGEIDALVAKELSEFDPEDIAFAMRVNAVRRLADAARIPVAEGTDIGLELTPGMLAERITGFTARLSCQR